MKITKSQLKRIIQEELSFVLEDLSSQIKSDERAGMGRRSKSVDYKKKKGALDPYKGADIKFNKGGVFVKSPHFKFEELDPLEEMRMPIPGSPDDPMARIAEIERRLEMIEIVIEMNMDTLRGPG
jgi:hypothetical protein